jgi:hypothetical protein
MPEHETQEERDERITEEFSSWLAWLNSQERMPEWV